MPALAATHASHRDAPERAATITGPSLSLEPLTDA
jgi:hypothetical protein